MSERPTVDHHSQPPSATFGNHTHSAPNVLETEAAFTAAQPVAEVAAKLREARMRGETPDTSVDELGINRLPIEVLEKWSFKRAFDAANGAEVPPLTETEEILLDTFKAEAEMVEAEFALGEDFDITPDKIDEVMFEAQDRAKKATTHEDRQKWLEIAEHAREYNERAQDVRDGVDGAFERFHDELVNPVTVRSAGTVLWALDGGEIEPGDTAGHQRVKKAQVDAKKMRKTTELYKLLMAGQIEESQRKIDPELIDATGGTTEVSREIYANKARIRQELAHTNPDSEAAKRLQDEQAIWQQRLRGMSQYNEALNTDEPNDLSRLSLTELADRRAFMAVWAETNPREDNE